MANRIIIQNGDLKHYGVLGMKWGVRKNNYTTNSLSKKVRKASNRFDRGRDPKKERIGRLSKKVRRQNYNLERKIKRAERFLSKNAKANASNVINRYNKDPAKKTLVENYVKSMQLNKVTLAELRLQLIDIRI